MNSELGNVLIIFGSFVAIIFLSIISKKIYYRLVLKKRLYIFPKINTKGIANIAMTIAIATAILLLLTIISSGLLGILFRAYPGWRVNIESILIKIGGLCFGPIIGLFVGVTTDLLSVALTAGMFHYGYCIAAALFGLLAGLISTLRNLSNNKKFIFYLFALGLLLFSFFIQFVFFNFIVNFNDPHVTDVPGAMSVEILGIVIRFKLWMINLYMLFILCICLLAMFYSISKNDRYEILYRFKLLINNYNIIYTHLVYKRFFKGGKDVQKASDKFLKWNYDNVIKRAQINKKINSLRTKSIEYKNNRGIDFVSVLVCTVVCENLIGTLLVPSFDVQFSALNLGYWLSFRLISMLPSTLLNLAIIYPIYKIIVPAMKYDYTSDSIEDINLPLVVE